jgi:SNF2 family DNA or RNA helicase
MPKLRLNRPARLDKLTNAFPFQMEAIETVRDKEYAAIFFEQGLGKTKIAIDLTLDWLLNDVVDSVIVVTKKGLVRNWQQEFKVHSHIKPRVLSSDRAANHRAFFSPARVYLANFEAIALEADRIKIFAKQRRLAIILDESQKIKNTNSKLTQAFFCISSFFQKRVIMTGTPMANRPYDIWSQVYFLDQGKSLGKEFSSFKSKLDLPQGDSSSYIEELSTIFPRISEFALRQTKEGSGLELPGKIYETRIATWEPCQRKMYDSIRLELRLQIIKNGIPKIDDAESFLKRLLRLVQITSNPKVIDEGYDKIPGKINTLAPLLKEIIDRQEKVIVWTSFVDNCRYLKERFSSYGSVQVHGRMAIEDRNQSIQRFKYKPECRLLIATPAAAKEGLTLTVANNVIFFDRSFSLDDYVQAQDRIHRISQTKTCNIFNITFPDSIDEWIGALINLKSASARYGLGDTDKEELEDALDANINEVLKSILGQEENNVEQ